MTELDDQQRLMNGIFWYGIPTLFRCEHDEDPANADIGLVGVPHSTGNGTTQRDQHLGPRAVRNVSAIGRRVHNHFGIDPWEMARVCDLGDVPLSEGNNNERSIEMVTEYYARIDAAGCRPVSIGGDHSITGGILQALGGGNLTGGEKACRLHLDAHTDAFHNIPLFMGAVKSAAHWASYLVTEGHVDPQHSVQVGIRGNTRSLEWLDPSYDLGYTVIKKTDYDSMGAEQVMEIIDETIGDRPSTSPSTSTASIRWSPPGWPTLRPASKGLASIRSWNSCVAFAARTSSAVMSYVSCRPSTRRTRSPAIARWRSCSR